MSRTPGQISSVGKALMLLDCLSSGGALTLRELSARTGYPKSSVHGLLSDLREHRMVAQDGDGRYCLGTHVFELGVSSVRQHGVLELAKPLMHAVAAKAGESVCLTLLDGDSALVLDSVPSPKPMRVMTDTGTRLPLHASAAGKAMLASLPPREALMLINRAGLNVYTPHTINSQAALMEECQRIRADGFAVENGEMRVGMRAVAVAVWDQAAQNVYALLVTGMFRKITDDAFMLARSLVASSAEQLKSALA